MLPPAAPPLSSPPVAVAHAPPRGIRQAVRRVMEAVDWPSALGPDPTVLVKPNLGWDLYVPGAVTSAEVLAAVVGVLLEGGREVVIVEADQVLVDIEVAARRAGVPALCRDPRVSWVNLSRGAFTPRRLPGARLFHTVDLPALIGAHPLVTVPVMKTHAKTGLSGALKNSWGLLPIDRYRYHPRVEDGIVDLARLARPELCVVDATVCLEGDGPKSGIPRREDHVFAGRDAAVVDWALARLMGLDPAELPHVVGALPEGFGGDADLRWAGRPPVMRPFARPRHNLVSRVEGLSAAGPLRRLVFDTPAFGLACAGARAFYHVWYHLGPGRTRREAP